MKEQVPFVVFLVPLSISVILILKLINRRLKCRGLDTFCEIIAGITLLVFALTAVTGVADSFARFIKWR
jgi:hypothetical protein